MIRAVVASQRVRSLGRPLSTLPFSLTSIQPSEPKKVMRPWNGVEDRHVTLAVMPLANSIQIATWSVPAALRSTRAVRARTLRGRPASETNMSVRWMPSAVIAPAGASDGLTRQLSGVMRGEQIVADIGLQMQDLAEFAGLDRAARILHRRFVAAFVPDAEHDPGTVARGENALGARGGQGQRLFAEDLLAGGNGREDLLLVLAVRGGDHDRVHIPVREHLVQGRVQREAMRSCEVRGHGGRGVHAVRDGEAGALGQTGDDLSAPPAESDHCGA